MPWTIFEAFFWAPWLFVKHANALNKIQGAIQYKSRCHYMEKARDEWNKKKVIWVAIHKIFIDQERNISVYIGKYKKHRHDTQYIPIKYKYCDGDSIHLACTFCQIVNIKSYIL